MRGAQPTLLASEGEEGGRNRAGPLWKLGVALTLQRKRGSQPHKGKELDSAPAGRGPEAGSQRHRRKGRCLHVGPPGNGDSKCVSF